jgi:hypothetical protein
MNANKRECRGAQMCARTREIAAVQYVFSANNINLD